MQSPARSTLPVTSLTGSISLQQTHSSVLVVMATEQFDQVHLTNNGQVHFIKLENLYTCTGFPCAVSKFHYNRNAAR